MDYKIELSPPDTIKTDYLILGIFQNQRLSPTAVAVDKISDHAISKALKHGDIEGKVGDCITLYGLPNINAERVLLVGCGDPKKNQVKQYFSIYNCAAKQVERSQAKKVVSYLEDLIDSRDLAWQYQFAVVAIQQALYRFTAHKSTPEKDKQCLKTWQLGITNSDNAKQLKNAVHTGQALAQGIDLSKDLANQPGNVATPSYLAKQAQQLAKQYHDIKTTVLSQSALAKLGAGAFISVAKGSEEPGKLIIMQYMRGPENAKPVVLVGKGITFDTGGISLKPGAAMDEMKFDMCGAASVIGTMQAIANMQAKVNLIGVVAAAENMPSGRASKPGDIVKTLSGQTVEILNTDAEGRLVLCDALTYVERFDPEIVIDIATLTGACVVALGKVPSGLLSNSQALAADLIDTGEKTGDKVWQLPLWEEYQDQLKSNFADMQNIGGRDAGTITAACFLSRFTEKYTWAHLDIAGTAWHSGANKGATGRPVSLLTQYILDKHAGV